MFEAAEDDRTTVREAMGVLRPRDRELLYMAYWERLTGSEIAQILRISVPAVWVRLSRARESLRAVLAPTSSRGGARNRCERPNGTPVGRSSVQAAG